MIRRRARSARLVALVLACSPGKDGQEGDACTGDAECRNPFFCESGRCQAPSATGPDSTSDATGTTSTSTGTTAAPTSSTASTSPTTTATATTSTTASSGSTGPGDDCLGLKEAACSRTPGCQAIYGSLCYKGAPEDPCLVPGFFVGCASECEGEPGAVCKGQDDFVDVPAICPALAELGWADCGPPIEVPLCGAGGLCLADAEPPCATCTKQSCCPEIDACSKDPECDCMRECVVSGDSVAECAFACMNDDPLHSPLTALLQCQTSQCTSECS